jgi:polyvinyl alcohol dehydrogenase (cytochrome)
LNPVKLIGSAMFLLAAAWAQDAGKLYQTNCASCHDGGMDRAPARDALKGMSSERVLAAMETGPMITMAVRLNAAERRALAEFLSQKSLSAGLTMDPPADAMCKGAMPAMSLDGPLWNGWGENTNNTRFQSAGGTGFSAAEVPRLKVKWVFGFPGDLQAYSQPVLAGGRLFTGSQAGRVYALNAKTGCIAWFFAATSSVRTAISIGRIGARYAAFFGDAAANAYAVDADTGKLIWKTKVDDFPVARITGSPVFHNGRLYVPVASGEEAAGASPDYQCCRFRGSMVALDGSTGKQVWKTYMIEEPQPTKKNAKGTQLWGPSGAPVWTSPAIDTRRNVLYATTGDNYSDPPTRLSDAFVAMDLDTGKIVWSRQLTEHDSYTSACRLFDKTNCPDSDGPDFDFASSPILVNFPGGKRALVAGQKSGVVHALDPDQQGEVLWQTRVGKGGTAGGVQWGSAADDSTVYVALSDIGRIKLAYAQVTDADPNVGGGMFAISLKDGKQLWHVDPAKCGSRPRCSPAQSAAVTAMPGVAFSGSVDGHLRAYSAKDGSIVWDFDSIREYKTVNGVAGRGGSMDGPGPAIGGGMLYVNSGYPSNGGTPGNVLIAFSVDGK